MLAWIVANWLNIVVGAVVVALVAVCLNQILPRKGRPAACAGCSGCGGSCPSCGGTCPHAKA